jgi:hypothetical protein
MQAKSFIDWLDSFVGDVLLGREKRWLASATRVCVGQQRAAATTEAVRRVHIVRVGSEAVPGQEAGSYARRLHGPAKVVLAIKALWVHTTATVEMKTVPETNQTAILHDHSPQS